MCIPEDVHQRISNWLKASSDGYKVAPAASACSSSDWGMPRSGYVRMFESDFSEKQRADARGRPHLVESGLQNILTRFGQ